MKQVWQKWTIELVSIEVKKISVIPVGGTSEHVWYEEESVLNIVLFL